MHWSVNAVIDLPENIIYGYCTPRFSQLVEKLHSYETLRLGRKHM